MSSTKRLPLVYLYILLCLDGTITSKKGYDWTTVISYSTFKCERSTVAIRTTISPTHTRLNWYNLIVSGLGLNRHHDNLSPRQ